MMSDENRNAWNRVVAAVAQCIEIDEKRKALLGYNISM